MFRLSVGVCQCGVVVGLLLMSLVLPVCSATMENLKRLVINCPIIG